MNERCQHCGHSLQRHELAGFEGECVADGCRCRAFRSVSPEPSRIRSVEQLVAVARETGDRRALLVIGRIQSMAAELQALIAAHGANQAAQAARERDEQYKARLAALPKPHRAQRPKAANRISNGSYPCPVEGCDHTARAPQGLSVHRRAVHEQSVVLCPGCGEPKKATGLAVHRARFCTGSKSQSTVMRNLTGRTP